MTTYDGSYNPSRGVLAGLRLALRLSFEVNGGLPMGQTHHWAALVFLAASRPFPAAEWPAATGVALDLLGPRRTTVLGQHVASFIHLPAGLAFRFAWTQVGEASARDNEAVAQIARGR